MLTPHPGTGITGRQKAIINSGVENGNLFHKICGDFNRDINKVTGGTFINMKAHLEKILVHVREDMDLAFAQRMSEGRLQRVGDDARRLDLLTEVRAFKAQHEEIITAVERCG